jgi:hypothetical protein
MTNAGRYARDDPMIGGVTRSVVVALVVAGLAVIWAPLALAGSPATKRQRSDPARLWSSFPLRQPAQRARTTTTRPIMRGPLLAPAESHASGSSRFRLFAIVATATFVGGVIAALLAGLLLRSAGARGGQGSRARLAARNPFRPTEGGSTMANLRRKLRALAEANASRGLSPEQAASEGAMSSRSALERVSAYSAVPEPTVADGAETPGEIAAGEEADAAEAEGSAENLAFVGEEVGTVLQSAREAAANIRRAAVEEARGLRAEAESAAAAELNEARRMAAAERAEGQRSRGEAEAAAKNIRASAEAFAQSRRQKAEREATQILGDAHRRLAAANAQVEQKVREAEAKAGHRRQALQAEAERYEKRLERILVVFHGMSSQLEDLLGEREAESEVTEGETEEGLRDALLPSRSGARIG